MDGGAVIAPAPVPMRQQSRRSSLTSAASTNSRLCSCVVKEIIATERQYVSDLRDLVDGYLACCRSHEFLTTTDIHDIFGNIETIYNLNSTFLADVESCTEDPVRVANCFLRRGPEFEVYAAYCTNYPRSQATLAYVLARPTVHEAFRCQQDSLGHSLPVSSYLHKPVQRVLKYPLLLQNLLKYYDSQGEGRRCIEAALRAIREMANHINEAKRASEHAVQAQQLLGTSQDDRDASDCGDLLMMGDFKLHGAKSYRHLFLFEKAVILAKRRDGDGETSYRKTIIKGCDLMLIESVPKEPLCFHLIHYRTPRKLYAVQAKSLDEKRAWCIGIKRLIIESLPGTIPDRSKHLLLSTGLEQGGNGGSSGESGDLLSPLSDGVPPMSSLAAVAAAAATAPPAKQTWLKSPNLLLRSNARNVPDYLERRRRKGPQFRSYIDLSHFVRKHLARRSDSVLSNGSYHEDAGKQTPDGDACVSAASEDNQCTKVALSPSEHSPTSSLYHWGSSGGLARSRSLGSLDMDSCRSDPADPGRSKLAIGSSYDDCCSRAHGLARLLAEKGADEALTELASAAYDSRLHRKKESLSRVARKSKHRTAFHGRPHSELLSPEEELRCSDTGAVRSPSSAGSDGAGAEVATLATGRGRCAASAAAATWPQLLRNGTMSSDEGYGHGGPEGGDVQQPVSLRGSASNRSSGADFSSPSRCSMASSETGSSSNELSAENDTCGSGDVACDDGHPLLLVTPADDFSSESDKLPAAAMADTAADATAVASSSKWPLVPLSSHSDVDERAGGADLLAVAASAGLPVSAAAVCVLPFDAESDVSDPRRSRCCSANSEHDESDEAASDELTAAGPALPHSRECGGDGKLVADQRTAAPTAPASSVVEQGTVPPCTMAGTEPPSLSGSWQDGQPMTQEVAAAAGEKLDLHSLNPSPSAAQQESPAAAAAALPSVFRLARQYSTKIKERPAHATVTRRGIAQQRGGRRARQRDTATAEKPPATAKQSLASLMEQDGLLPEDGEDSVNSKPLPLSASCLPSTAPSTCETEETVDSRRRVADGGRGAPTAAPSGLVPYECTGAHSACPDTSSADDGHLSDAADRRCPRSSGRAISAALRERMRSLERPPTVPRVFTFTDIDGQQLDSLKDRIRMLQTSSTTAAASGVAPTKDPSVRELTPPSSKAVPKASKAAAYNRCNSLPSDTAVQPTAPLYTAVVAKVASNCGAAMGRSSRKLSRTEDTAISSGYVRNIVQKFQVH